MKDGWWLNAESGKYFEVDDHALWVSQPANAKKLGLNKEEFLDINGLEPTNDNDRVLILKAVMDKENIRVRGHGNSTTFEFTMNTEPALWAIYSFGDKIGLGPFSNIYVANVRTKENYQDTWEGFKAELTNKGEEAVLRRAKKGRIKFNYPKRRKK